VRPRSRSNLAAATLRLDVRGQSVKNVVSRVPADRRRMSLNTQSQQHVLTDDIVYHDDFTAMDTTKYTVTSCTV